MKLTEECNKEVEKIKRKYSFGDQFDLLEKLNYLPTAIALYPSIPRSGDIKKQLTNLIKTIKKMIETLVNTSAQTKIIINQIPADLIQIGYKDIRGENTDWHLSKFESYLDVLHIACLFAKQKMPPDVGGKSGLKKRKEMNCRQFVDS
jgi:hypothetical protein